MHCGLIFRLLRDSHAEVRVGGRDISSPASCGKVSREIMIRSAPTEDQLADCFTKSIAAGWLDAKASHLGLEFRKGRTATHKNTL